MLLMWVICCVFMHFFLFSGFVLEPVGGQPEKLVENNKVDGKNAAGFREKDDTEKNDENQAEGIDPTKEQKTKMKDESKNHNVRIYILSM